MLNSVMLSGFSTLARETMQKTVENLLNPGRYYLSKEATKRLGWMYVVVYECRNNVSVAARKIGVSRPWLSILKNKWEFNKRDPRSLEPRSKAPHHTNNRQRISKEKEKQIIAVRDEYGWGKDKIAVVLKRDYKTEVSATTVNRYLSKYNRIDVRLSEKNKRAWKNKRAETSKRKCRPPVIIKDYKPGALVEKDMKFVLKSAVFANDLKYRAKENFIYQHTIIDSFTRLRVLELCRESDSKTAVARQKYAVKRLPFPVACANTDGGGENGGYFSDYLLENNIQHFYSRTGTPTDNPRVERSHRTDDIEFWNRRERKDDFQEERKDFRKWEDTYNLIRPHQALGMLTPMAFYELWKNNPKQAYAIKDRYQKYLKKNAKRLATSRTIKRKEEIERLMQQIDEKLNNSYH